jgi:cell filamentation protein
MLFKDLAGPRLLRGLKADGLAARAAHLLAEINAVHPFREGNGRTQLAFLTLLADKVGHPLSLERMQPTAMLEAVIASFGGTEKPLADMIFNLEKQE